ncbi:MAG: cytochrome c3 family protein [Nitrospirota bacterium]|nr:cytochrome c3 family protein [Nitrospirota bacterium]
MGRGKLAVLLAVVGVWIGVGSVYGDNVTMSRHNMSRLVQGEPVLWPPDARQATYVTPMAGVFYNQYNEVCVYCHTPHGANQNVQAPLWNRAVNNNGTYTPYSSSTIDTDVGQPGGVSLACLSCHDGTIAVDSIINAPGSGKTWGDTPNEPVAVAHLKMNMGECGGCHNGTIAHDGNIKYLTQNLKSTHPISMTYPTLTDADPMFIAPGSDGKFANGIKLYNGKVECASCHNPHLGEADYATNPGLRPFLRVSNSQSAMCTTCHIK